MPHRESAYTLCKLVRGEDAAKIQPAELDIQELCRLFNTIVRLGFNHSPVSATSQAISHNALDDAHRMQPE
jgi:hypothetical protein